MLQTAQPIHTAQPTEPADIDHVDLAHILPAACGLFLASFFFLLLAFCV